MIKILAYVIPFLTTPLVSYLHGADKVTKGLLLSGHVLAISLFSFLLFFQPLSVITGGILSLYYWFLFRSSRQAKAELDYMYRVQGVGLSDVLTSYILPVGLTIKLVVAYVVFADKPFHSLFPLALILGLALHTLIVKNSRHVFGKSELDRKQRAKVEISNGFLGTIAICSLVGPFKFAFDLVVSLL